jgi:hypothetical protein
MNVLLDGIDELGVLLGGVGVVHTEVAKTVVLLRGGEVNDHRLAMADVEIAVGLGRETGVDLHAGIGKEVLIDEIVYKIIVSFFHDCISLS